MNGAKWVLFCLLLGATVMVTPAGSRAQDAETELGRDTGSVEERRLLVSIEEERARRRAEFEKSREELALREMELKTLETEVDKKLNELRSLREELKLLLAEKSEAEKRRIKELGQMIEKMEPSKGAAVLEELEEDLAIGVLSKVKRKSAGRLLSAMDATKAASLSAAYTEAEKD